MKGEGCESKKVRMRDKERGEKREEEKGREREGV